MENSENFLEYVYKFFKPIFLLIINFLLMGLLISMLYYYSIKIDESKIESMKYCPSCGVSLVK